MGDYDTRLGGQLRWGEEESRKKLELEEEHGGKSEERT